ncbi:TlpA disulfide reductase family protein [Sphingobacterium gobiense]|uniref:Thioredoxin n=1 Tax=Sphingobacterium gobiense TaxID=1382456 RepID=A0A2S9JGD5_9SPHI|nr:TlpA disulfide reductase family protein [Sphingobacterium gobiense]PRD52007.1 thioredoxin [Sphingobacterium gobiense]
MKKVFPIFGFAALFICCIHGVFAQAQTKAFRIDGRLNGKTNIPIYLHYERESDQKPTVDSTKVESGKFYFSGSISHPTAATITTERELTYFTDKSLSVILEPSAMTLNIDYAHFDQGSLQGSIANQEQYALNVAQADVQKKMRPLYEEYQKATSILMSNRENSDPAVVEAARKKLDEVQAKMAPYSKQLNTIQDSIVQVFPGGFTAAQQLMHRLSDLPLSEAEAAYNTLSAGAKMSVNGRYIAEKLIGKRKGSVGAKAPQFAGKELRGEQLRLSDYRGQYVLLDFWASWCVPCRKGNPHLLDLYASYKDKGFEIIGIASDDGKKEAWKKAVEDDQIGIWKHVLSGQDMEKRRRGEKNELYIGGQYGIATLPTKILIDPKGVIIGRYGSDGGTDDDLDRKLAEIFE